MIFLGAVCHLLQRVQVFAENLECNVAARAGDGFVHAHLHRLGDVVRHAGNLVERFLQVLSELLLALSICVLSLGVKLRYESDSYSPIASVAKSGRRAWSQYW